MFYKEAKDLFNNAADLQRQKRYDEAIVEYQKLITLSPENKNRPSHQTQNAALIIDEGLLQMVYCYIYAEKRKDGVDLLDNLYNSNSYWLSILRRDVRDMCRG